MFFHSNKTYSPLCHQPHQQNGISMTHRSQVSGALFKHLALQMQIFVRKAKDKIQLKNKSHKSNSSGIISKHPPSLTTMAPDCLFPFRFLPNHGPVI